MSRSPLPAGATGRGCHPGAVWRQTASAASARPAGRGSGRPACCTRGPSAHRTETAGCGCTRPGRPRRRSRSRCGPARWRPGQSTCSRPAPTAVPRRSRRARGSGPWAHRPQGMLGSRQGRAPASDGGPRLGRSRGSGERTAGSASGGCGSAVPEQRRLGPPRRTGPARPRCARHPAAASTPLRIARRSTPWGSDPQTAGNLTVGGVRSCKAAQATHGSVTRARNGSFGVAGLHRRAAGTGGPS